MSRRATGLKRPFPLQIDTTKEEDEYISRVSYPASKSEYIRKKIFKKGWEEELGKLRKEQKGNEYVWSPRKGMKR